MIFGMWNPEVETLPREQMEISGGPAQRQAMLLQDLGGQVLCCTPSYALCIAEALESPRTSVPIIPLRLSGPT